jgi:hypothetical protein
MDWVSAAAVALMAGKIVRLRNPDASSTHCAVVLEGRSDVRGVDASIPDGECSSCRAEPPVFDSDIQLAEAAAAEEHRCRADTYCSTRCMVAVEVVVAGMRSLAGEAADSLCQPQILVAEVTAV